MNSMSRGGMGSGGNCICPRCGYKQPHRPGVPCREEKCPKCGAKMLREGGYHHNLVEEKKRKKAEKDKEKKKNE
ncbi:MAG: ferredoxin [Candidatus Latescibacteria bacterium 4484_7]|nr:MAG: ferredoxin [Candidatus Latescibacteria bacterium 4484_7]RKZ08712.1 MAG: ferredoxin [bacterium]